MYAPLPVADRRARDRAPATALFGLAEETREQIAALQDRKIDQVAAVWPLTLVTQVVAGAILIATCVCAPAGAGLAPFASLVGIHVAVVATVSVALLCVLRVPALRRWRPFRRNRMITLGVVAMSALLASLLWTTMRMPSGPLQIACFTAVAGTILVSAVSIHAVRAATLGFGVGAVLAVAALTGPGVALVMALLGLVGLVVVTRKLAQVDHDRELDRAEQASAGDLAVRMIAEFEGEGTGWFWEADRQGKITYLSAKVVDDLGLAGGAIGQPLTGLFKMDSDAPGTERTLAFHIASRTSFSDYSVRSATSDGEQWWSISGRPVVDELGRFQGFIGSGSDLTEKRRSEAEITRLALFDGLTGLANRQRMRLSLDKTLAQLAGPYRATSLLLIDLDRFKAVNDTLGHQAGDALLKLVAQRLQRGVGDAGLVGRLGGDEFEVVLPSMDNRDTLATLARDLIASLSQPYSVAGTAVTIGCSIGIAIAPGDGNDTETLVRNADLALYAAKADGRGVHRFFSDDMLAGAKTRKLLEDDLRSAVATGAFHLCYQPVVNTKTTRVVGYEALIRWNHPTRGLVSPADFIPVAEECGLIEAIGEWVLRTACIEAARWPDAIRVAVNVSPIQFANPVLPALVTSALAQSGISANRLELEITEGVFLDETSSSEQMFKSLKGIGVRLALDDFGTGYSSLGYLRNAPFDKIKIDQSFVKGAAEPGNRNAAIIKAIVTLADTLGMETTAEGVEIQDEIDLIRDLGCSHIQGYVYGRPVSAEDALLQLAAENGIATPSGFKVSRAPRTKMLRSAGILIDGVRGDVRIRDISTSGAMIDGIAVDGDPDGLEMLIELVEDQMVPARIRWAHNGKAGIEFHEAFNLAKLNQTQGFRLRRTG
ncbi:EAL domain-containing protein [Sphingomonas sp. PP-CE-1G-424]|uniref:EAL domain-containing protein n=1 Tax=Sphingomonas sp. PP-CE-1G-424 TaxID=2135658 RepID=UPI00105440EB|nr:EAL domain-containing protein [Sphingomonas sp. PP-CE-1G-424]TCP72626.1 diguanylate cyclase/phosphodiesterase with PAS/PAC sensor(s) [Sphingomonas sp. PP-CE-1G-424]